MRFHRIIQIISLCIFLILLTGAVTDVLIVSDFFLRLDPVLISITAISGRIFLTAFLPAVIVLLTGFVAGRIFCGYVCPMGTTLDVIKPSRSQAGALKRRKIQSEDLEGFRNLQGLILPGNKRFSFRKLKYSIFAFLIGASVFKISFVFAASPLSLITRFYGLLIYPVQAFLTSGILRQIQPLADYLDLRTLAYAQIETPHFATQLFILVFFALLFTAGRFFPRFWCRYLCPAGAMMALVSRKPLIRRHVSDDCTACGKCVRTCPMNVIPEDAPVNTQWEECIVCRTCERVCPVNAVKIGIFRAQVARRKSQTTQHSALSTQHFSPTRRDFIYSGLMGAGTAIVTLTGLNSPYGKSAEGKVLPPELIRPPGALPEPDFLSQCVRCGECMTACSTNTLQPIWLSVGFVGIFSPAVIPRRRYCDPKCTRCGEVCPTGAIRKLSKTDRIWAKIGTALIFRQKCLAWEFQKSCMVCDEVCPFDAIEFKREPGNPFAVPHVIENKCAGCGYCEHFCPVQNQTAIVVMPMGALRLKTGSYEKEAKQQGLQLLLKPKTGGYGLPDDQESGFSEKSDSSLAPGFEEAPGFEPKD